MQRDRASLFRQPSAGGTGLPHLQENAPHWDPTVGLCLGSYGGPMGGGAVSYERGTPVGWVSLQGLDRCRRSSGQGWCQECSLHAHFDNPEYSLSLSKHFLSQSKYGCRKCPPVSMVVENFRLISTMRMQGFDIAPESPYRVTSLTRNRTPLGPYAQGGG